MACSKAIPLVAAKVVRMAFVTAVWKVESMVRTTEFETAASMGVATVVRMVDSKAESWDVSKAALLAGTLETRKVG